MTTQANTATNDTLIAEATNPTDAAGKNDGTAADAVITAAKADSANKQPQADGKTTLEDGKQAPDSKTEGDDATKQKDGETKTDDEAKKDDAKEGPPEKYEIKLPEGETIDPKVMGEFEAVAKELGLSNANAQKLAEFGPKIASLVANKTTETINAAKVDWHKQSMNDKEFGGDKYRENLAVAKKALDSFASPGLVSLLKETGLQMHPEVIRLLYKAGKTISEDSMVNGGNNDKTEDKSPADILYGGTKVTKK